MSRDKYFGTKRISINDIAALLQKAKSSQDSATSTQNTDEQQDTYKDSLCLVTFDLKNTGNVDVHLYWPVTKWSNELGEIIALFLHEIANGTFNNNILDGLHKLGEYEQTHVMVKDIMSKWIICYNTIIIYLIWCIFIFII